MGRDLMRYDLLTQDAMRGVVRETLSRIVRDGLPGSHHFFIAFQTGYPGVELSDALRARYPDEMTIVLQHQFWDLKVAQDRFSVSLSFNGIIERLGVPFAAIKSFFDPSVPFGLQFHPSLPEEVEDRAVQSGGQGPARAPAAMPAERQAGDVVSLDAFRKK
ncbi:MAG: hypothetical protein H6923_08200 [Alphaproteobacteria bacterium]|nr:hypothetical protein [Alphaproteobacteria bacterium]